LADPLRILLLEDTPADAELNERELRKAGIDFISRRVDTRDAFVRALEEFHPDVILSDYNLPGFDGLSALELVRRDHPHIPVIMVTGALADVEAVELIHAGARDYVLKDRRARLAVAVQQVLSAEQGIRARKAAEEKFRKISESAQDAIIMMADKRISFWNAAAERIFGYSAAEAMGQEVHALLAPPQAQAPFTLGYPNFQKSGEGPSVGKVLELTAMRKGGEAFPIELSVSSTRLNGQWHAIGIVRDISKRKQSEEKLRVSAERLGLTLSQTVDAVASMIESRDPYTAGHQRRVATLAGAIAREMGFSADRIQGLYLSATIHDLGKIQIPAEILSKPGRLSPIEFELIKTHPQAGYTIIKNVEFPWPIAQMVLQHHERLDGSGYPQGLKNEQILPEAKILGVSDVVEAMASHRPYRPALGLDVALQEISRYRGELYDPAVVDCCLALFREKRFSFDSPSPK